MTLSNSSLAGQEEKGGNWKRGRRKNLFSREKAVSFSFPVKTTDSHMQKRRKINPPLLLEEEGKEEEGEEGGPPTLPSLSRTKSEKSRR